MTKVNKRNFILTLAAILFAAITALLFITPKPVVKADEPETPAVSNYTKQEQFAAGAKLAGKLVVIRGDYSDIDPGTMLFIAENPETFFVCPIGSSIMHYVENGAFSPIDIYTLTSSEIAEVSAATGINNISLAFIVPYASDTGIIFTDMALSEVSSIPELEYFLLSYVNPETTVFSNYTQQEQFVYRAKLSGKLIVICGDFSGIEPGKIMFETYNPITVFRTPIEGVVYCSENSTNSTAIYPLTSSEMAEVSTATGINNISLAFLVPTMSGTGTPFTDMALIGHNDTLGLDFYLFSFVGSGSGSGENNGNNGNNGNGGNGGQNTGGTNGGAGNNNNDNSPEEQKPFDIIDWLQNASNDASKWVGENLGLSVTGGTIFVVGAVVLFLFFRRRR